MKKFMSLVCLIALIGLSACNNKIPEITNAYSFATSAAQSNGAVFMTISKANDQLIDVAPSVLADRVELHTHTNENGHMSMHKIESIALKDGAVLKPMGDHIMLMGLKRPLVVGERFPLTLTFEKAGDIIVDVQIVTPGTLHHN